MKPFLPQPTRVDRKADASAPDEAAAFEEWISPHWSLLHSHARRLSGSVDGEDVLQDALTAAWRKRHQCDPSRGTAQAWLLAIVSDRARKARRRTRHQPSELSGVKHDNDDVVGSADITRALSKLTSRQREAVSLYYYQDLPVAEVALGMRCSVGTVKSTLSDARSRLRDLLGEEY